jgi:hypothetical protein
VSTSLIKTSQCQLLELPFSGSIITVYGLTDTGHRHGGANRRIYATLVAKALSKDKV